MQGIIAHSCQTKSNMSQSAAITQIYEADLVPLNESGYALLLISLSVFEMSFVIEVIVYLTVIKKNSSKVRHIFKISTQLPSWINSISN